MSAFPGVGTPSILHAGEKSWQRYLMVAADRLSAGKLVHSSQKPTHGEVGKDSAMTVMAIIRRFKMKLLTRDCAEFLIIDDDPVITRFLVTYLKHKGHTCQSLIEGFRTAAWLELHDCEVVIVDLKMPKVDGISLISYIRDINRNIPIIVFTGAGYDEDRMHAALRAGANGYVSKNLPIEQLYCVLSRVLATSQQRSRTDAIANSRPALLGAA